MASQHRDQSRSWGILLPGDQWNNRIARSGESKTHTAGFALAAKRAGNLYVLLRDEKFHKKREVVLKCHLLSYDVSL